MSDLEKPISSTQKLANSMGLSVSSPDQVVQGLAINILQALLLKTQDASPTPSTDDQDRHERMKALAHAWANGAEPDAQEAVPTIVLGQPGSGKLTAFTIAARHVAQAVGMQLLINPAPDAAVGSKDLVVLVQECESVSPGFLEKPDEAFQAEQFQKRLSQQLTTLAKAGGGVLVLDRVEDLSPSAQSVVLGLTGQTKGHGTYLGLTADLSRSGAISTALRGHLTVDCIDPLLVHPAALDAAQFGVQQAALMRQVGALPRTLTNVQTDMVINAKLMRGFPSLKDLGQKLDDQASSASPETTSPTARRQP